MCSNAWQRIVKQRIDLGLLGNFRRQDAFFRPIAQGYSRSRAPEQYHHAVLFARSSNRANNSAKILLRYIFRCKNFNQHISIVRRANLSTRHACMMHGFPFFFRFCFISLYFFSSFNPTIREKADCIILLLYLCKSSTFESQVLQKDLRFFFLLFPLALKDKQRRK